MEKHYQAMIKDKQVLCPTCGHERFFAQEHVLPHRWMEPFLPRLGKRGALLICQNCSRVLQFADVEAIAFTDEHPE